MNFGRPNPEIVWKMANGRLLFLALILPEVQVIAGLDSFCIQLFKPKFHNIHKERECPTLVCLVQTHCIKLTQLLLTVKGINNIKAIKGT